MPRKAQPNESSEQRRVRDSLYARDQHEVRAARIAELDRKAAEDLVVAQSPVVAPSRSTFVSEGDKRSAKMLEDLGQTLDDLPNPELELRTKEVQDKERRAKIDAIPHAQFEKERLEMFRPIPTDDDDFYREAMGTVEEYRDLPAWLKPS